MDNKEEVHCYKSQGPGGRVLEACLLCLLREKGEDYGYGLLAKLSEIGFVEEHINIGTLYRSLRKLERQGLVESHWMESERGPRRRVYNITERGEEELEDLIDLLENRKGNIDLVLKYYRKLSYMTL
ncbi:MAG TPA: PadR family transcriptional regulator [Tepidimicrobium sp.]|nr:PadR family transcriptional regulator [Tepidimicrobium sp.]